MTRRQKRNLASLVLLHGYDNCLEFYDELVAGASDVEAYPPAESIRETLDKWHAHIIALADLSDNA
jgi:hypothetical protein